VRVQELKGVEVDEISFVTAGDNKEAKITMLKLKGGKKMAKDEDKIDGISKDELKAMIGEMVVTAMKAIMEGKKDKAEDDVNEVKEDKAVEAKDEKAEDKKEEDENSMEKSKEVITLEKKLAVEKSKVDAFVEEATVNVFAKTAEQFKDLPIDQEVLAKMIRTLEHTEMKKEFNDLLTSLQSSINTDLFKTIGAEGSDTSPHETKLDNLAKERSKKDNVSFAKAYTLVLKDNPELYTGAE